MDQEQHQAQDAHATSPHQAWRRLYFGTDDQGVGDARRLLAWAWSFGAGAALAIGAGLAGAPETFTAVFAALGLLLPAQVLVAAVTGRLVRDHVRIVEVVAALTAVVALGFAADLRTDVLVALACGVGAFGAHLLLRLVVGDRTIDLLTARLAGIGAFVLGLHSVAAAVAGALVLPVVAMVVVAPLVVGFRALLAPLLPEPTEQRSAFSYPAGLAAALAVLLVVPGLPDILLG